MEYMFCNCRRLTSLDVTIFNTNKVTDMSWMFYDCRNLTSLDIRNFNTSNVTKMGNMFSSCPNLAQIKISNSWDVTSVTSSSNMFIYSANLPNYNANYVDVSMAKPTTQGGYLTLV
jgi:surface protein